MLESIPLMRLILKFCNNNFTDRIVCMCSPPVITYSLGENLQKVIQLYIKLIANSTQENPFSAAQRNDVIQRLSRKINPANVNIQTVEQSAPHFVTQRWPCIYSCLQAIEYAALTYNT